MAFNPDSTKQVVQIVFLHKSKQIDHTKIYFNVIQVETVNDHKHLGLILVAKLSFASHINDKISKAFKWLGIFKSLCAVSCRIKKLNQIFKMYI